MALENGSFLEPDQEEEPTLDPYEPSRDDDDDKDPFVPCVNSIASDDGDDSGRGTPDSNDSEDQWFDADSELPPPPRILVPSASFVQVVPSPSMSVLARDGDPPDVEEEIQLNEVDDMHEILTSNWSIVMHVLSQVRIGMDLTRFALPVFFLEKRSLLQMYAEFFAHPDMLANVTDIRDPEKRMVEIVRWFLLSINASRKGVDPKKPYNPVLGETFHCYWDLPQDEDVINTKSTHDIVQTGPVPYAGSNSLAFVAEQVSHHPPISAFYAECPSKRMYVNGTVASKTKFLGLSVKAHNTGCFRIYYLDHDEEYVATLPNGYVRSILMSPWFEFGGECTVTCAKSGYVAKIEFHTKPFRGGKRHKVTAEIKHRYQTKPALKLEGEWNNIVFTKPQKSDKSKEVFMDAGKVATIRKKVKKLSVLDPCDSRAVWRHVTEAMVQGDSEAAAEAKHAVEEKQRAEARERIRTGREWKQKLFRSSGDAGHEEWVYMSPLKSRLSRSS